MCVDERSVWVWGMGLGGSVSVGVAHGREGRERARIIQVRAPRHSIETYRSEHQEGGEPRGGHDPEGEVAARVDGGHASWLLALGLGLLVDCLLLGCVS